MILYNKVTCSFLCDMSPLNSASSSETYFLGLPSNLDAKGIGNSELSLLTFKRLSLVFSVASEMDFSRLLSRRGFFARPFHSTPLEIA